MSQDTNNQNQIYQQWQDAGLFKADPTSSKKPFGLLMPPPNLTGELHMGHAMQHSILDAIARFRRMQGYDVLLMPGVDHAGIQFESTFEKKLAKEDLSKYKLGREEWLKRAWQFRDEIYQNFHQSWTVFGISADWSREVFSLEPKMQQAVLKEFQTFWEQNLLYKGAYIVQWCPKDQTAIEDVEMEYEEKKEKLYYIEYKVQDSDQTITIATARPETIAADVAIAVYPQHPQFQKLVGKLAQNPFTNTWIPIIEDKRVEKDFGTGALKITPGHDLLDYQIGQDHKLPILHAVGKDGKITDLDPDLQGLKIQEARQKAAEKLQQLGLIAKEEEYTHSVPVCERCKTTVEPLISEEWFVKMQPLADKALANITRVKFYPDNYQSIISDWLNQIHDWCISRPLWWGHRIPVWYCQKSNPNHLVGHDQDMVIALDKPTENCQCGANDWVPEEKILDTWFSSSLWPMGTLGWPEQTEELARYYPWDFELTSPEIKFMWIARMIMLGLWFQDDIPFKNMFFHGTMRDLQGRKMSKSLGNGIDPLVMIDQWGTDAVRMALYSYSAPGRDPKASRQTMDERCKNFRNFATKLRNITRFVVELKPEDSKTNSDFSHEEDTQIIQYLNATTAKVTEHLENYQLHLAIDELYDFIWHKFADSYIELSKKRRSDAQPCLEYILNSCIRLLHPFMPFVTEEVWQQIEHQEQFVMTAAWPEARVV